MTSTLRAIALRLVPALITALGVVLVTAGLLSYADQTAPGLIPEQAAVVETLSPSDSPGPLPSATPRLPTASPSESPSDSPAATGSPSDSASPGPGARAVATRVVVPALGIDLPVVRGNGGYPYCNVAMYLHTGDTAATDGFGQPGEGRATYLYAHARDGMFGPIYKLAIQQGKASKMLGMIVQVYTSDDKLYLYEIREFRLHSLSLDAPLNVKDEEIWLQTSEGPKGTPGKTQLRGFLLSVGAADPADAHPQAKPLVCG
jgi:hypothetical protein